MNNSYPEMVLALQAKIGKRLRNLRIGKGLSQTELAAKVKGGVDYTYIGRIERGKQLPSLKVLLGISETLGVAIDCFFNDEPETIYFVDQSAQLGFLLKDEKGRELLDTLKLLPSCDIPLILEIIKILTRHGNIKEQARSGEPGSREANTLTAVAIPPFLEE